VVLTKTRKKKKLAPVPPVELSWVRQTLVWSRGVRVAHTADQAVKKREKGEKKKEKKRNASKRKKKKKKTSEFFFQNCVFVGPVMSANNDPNDAGNWSFCSRTSLI
jgi:hypothetical protein